MSSLLSSHIGDLEVLKLLRIKHHQTWACRAQDTERDTMPFIKIKHGPGDTHWYDGYATVKCCMWSHRSCLINLGAPDSIRGLRSTTCFMQALKRRNGKMTRPDMGCLLLVISNSITYFTFHLGSWLKTSLCEWENFAGINMLKTRENIERPMYQSYS